MDSLFDQETLFETEEQEAQNKRLNVVEAKFCSVRPMEWKELFDGYDFIHVITYSSGINFVYELSKRFKQMDVIFGCEEVISYSLQEVMAFQGKLLETMRKKLTKSKQGILDRLNDGSVKFSVANKRLSHAKIYLLESENGAKRVITGSANMSYNAFGGRQEENIQYMDGPEAFDWYMEVFNDLKVNCTDEISRQAIAVADLQDNIDALPISETVKQKKLIIIEQTPEANEEIHFSLDLKLAADKIAPMVTKEDKKTKKTYFTVDELTKIRKRVIDEAKKEQDFRSEYPHLRVNINEQTVTLNDKPLDLNPTEDEIKNDVNLFIKYMDGFKDFHGDVDSMQSRYYEFANWFLCSPFMAPMRDMAARYDQNKLPYPVFGLLYGKSKAGKTSFLETLLIMMIGQKPKISAPDFTRKSIESLKYNVEGAPIIVDDLTNTRFNQHAIETIKNDDFGVSTHMIHYPAVVISANEDVKAVAPEVIRRCVICRADAGLTNTEVMKSSLVRNVQHNIKTALYREFLRRMLEEIPELIDEIRSDEIVSAPDILNHSSKILKDIVDEYYDGECPKYIRELTLENYFSEQVTGKYAMTNIQKGWQTNRNSFEISVKNNELRYNIGDIHEASRILKELPENLEAHKSRDIIIMNLEEAKKFFEIDFKLPWYKRLFR